MNRIENIFGDEIEKTVFISDEQLHDKNAKALYGKFYEDTNIYNIFPAQLSDQGEYLCDVLEQTDIPETAGLCAIFSDEQLEFFYDGKKLKVESYGLYQSIFSRNTPTRVSRSTAASRWSSRTVPCRLRMSIRETGSMMM